MALRRPKAGSVSANPNPQDANDVKVVRSQERVIGLESLAVSPLTGLVESIEQSTQLVVRNEERLNLSNCEQLMRNVQVAQRNATEALNRLSSYRKTVARILEQRRREAASIRKQAGKGDKQEDILDIALPNILTQAPLVEPEEHDAE